jgi:hypothetical protein
MRCKVLQLWNYINARIVTIALVLSHIFQCIWNDTRPDRFWDASNLLPNDTGVSFPADKAAGA